MNISGLTVSTVGLVTDPEWSYELSTSIIRDLRKAKPEEGCDVASESDIMVLARVAHELFSESQSAYRWPLFLKMKEGARHSIYSSMLLSSRQDDTLAFARAEETDILIATNIARWLLKLPQQTGSHVLFVSGPQPRVRRSAPLRAAG